MVQDERLTHSCLPLISWTLLPLSVRAQPAASFGDDVTDLLAAVNLTLSDLVGCWRTACRRTWNLAFDLASNPPAGGGPTWARTLASMACHADMVRVQRMADPLIAPGPILSRALADALAIRDEVLDDALAAYADQAVAAQLALMVGPGAPLIGALGRSGALREVLELEVAAAIDAVSPSEPMVAEQRPPEALERMALAMRRASGRLTLRAWLARRPDATHRTTALQIDAAALLGTACDSPPAPVPVPLAAPPSPSLPPAAPASAAELRDLADHAMLQGRYRMALQHYTAALQLDDTQAQALFNQAQAHFGLGEWQIGLRCYQQAIAQEPSLRMTAPGLDVTGVLGVGRLGLLLEARDTSDRRFAVRVLSPSRSDAERLERFRETIERLTSVDHPDLIRPQLTRHAGRFQILCEKAEGGSLADHPQADSERLLLIVSRVAEQVAALHAAGMVHGRLTPSVVFLDEGRVRLAGIGHACLLPTHVDSSVAELGTAPEQMLAPATTASDVYAIGRLLLDSQTRLSMMTGGVRGKLLGLISAATRSEPDRRPTLGELRRMMAEVRDVPQPLERVELQPKDTKASSDELEVPDGMVFVAGGRYSVGRHGSADAPPIEVLLSAYFIDRYPVTNEQYLAFCRETGHAPPAIDEDWAEPFRWQGGTYPAGTGDHPMCLATHEDARAFASWVGKRLPSELQWEVAARGTTERSYPWGDAIDASCCNHANHLGAITPVSSHDDESPTGCRDMCGNVWEWVRDRYAATSYETFGTRHDAVGIEGETYVQRGGAFDSDVEQVRCDARSHADPKRPGRPTGFRLVRQLARAKRTPETTRA